VSSLTAGQRGDRPGNDHASHIGVGVGVAATTVAAIGVGVVAVLIVVVGFAGEAFYSGGWYLVTPTFHTIPVLTC